MSNMGSSEVKEFSSIKVFSKLVPYLIKRWKYFLLAVFCMFFSSQLSVIVPDIVRRIVDEGIVAGNFNVITILTAVLIAISILTFIADYFERYSSILFAQNVIMDLRIDVYDAIQRQSFTFFDRTPTGQLISRVTNDVDTMSRFLQYQLRAFIRSIIMTILALTFMFKMNVNLSIISILLLPIFIVINLRYSSLIRPLYSLIRNQFGVLTSIVNNSIVGIRTIKVLSIEDEMLKNFSNENDRLLEISLKASKVRSIYGYAGQLIVGLATSIILLYGGYLIINGELTIGELTAFNSYFLMLLWPMRAIGFFITGFERSMAVANRLFEIISRIPEVNEKPNAIDLQAVKGEVVFENVSFEYVPGKPVLRNINLKVKAGEKIAIIGPVGSGKSTLIKLIPRFYDVTSGRILIDGVDIRDVKIRSLRKHIAIVSQEPFLFAGTIRENIAFGNPNASMENIIKAAKIAKIHDFIESLPQKYDTIIGERGITLSGGQKQRIAIARALVTNPKILILDDPTSNLDAETEKKLVDDLKEILKGRTVFIVTQRLSLLRLADRIVVLDKGEVVEEGTHEELISKKGLYYRLYKTFLKTQVREVAIPIKIPRDSGE